jgi:hypothetical protein
LTPPNDIGTDEKETIRIKIAAWANHRIPPASFAVFGLVFASGVGIARERVEQKNGIIAGFVEMAVSFVG